MISRELPKRFYLLPLIICAAWVAISLGNVGTKFDQTNTGLLLSTLSQSPSDFSPLGQSFTATLTSLNFVNLLTENGPATVEVNIRLGSISGRILGTSQPTVIPFSLAPSVSSFRFSKPVPLIARELYVIEPFVVSGHILVVSTNTNNYIGGNQILGGVAQTNNDLWFQEGISVPEPGAASLRDGRPRLGWLLLGILIGLLVLFKNRPFCTD